MSAMPPLAHESSLRLPRREPRASFALGAANLLLLLGGIGAGASAAAVVYFLAIDMQGAEFDAHRGLLAFVALPGLMIFFFALAAVAGWWRRRIATARPPETGPGRRPPGRRSGPFLLLSMTALAVPLLLGAVGFRAVSFMESAEFCAACHGVMGPQVQAHQVSPHAEVACTKCHIGAEAGPVGPGSGEYIKAKIGGMRQTLSVVLNDYDRPIRAPAGKIPHTAETCEGCHSPDKDYGVSVRVYRSYLPDEGNTSHRRVLAFRVGGKILASMQSPEFNEGRPIWSTGVYREIVPLERIVMTDSFADEKGNVVPATHYGMGEDIPLEMLVTVTLEDLGGKTRMTMRHEGLPAGEMKDGANQGWSESFDKLAEYLAQA